MARKILVIKSCPRCPFNRADKYTGDETWCVHEATMDLKLPFPFPYTYKDDIPNWCPLEDAPRKQEPVS